MADSPLDPRSLAALPRELRTLLAVGDRLEHTNESLERLVDLMDDVKQEIQGVREDTSELPGLHGTMQETAKYSREMDSKLDEMTGHMEVVGELRSTLEESGTAEQLPDLVERLPKTLEGLSEQLERMIQTVDRLSETTERLGDNTEKLHETTGQLADGTAPIRAIAERFGRSSDDDS